MMMQYFVSDEESVSAVDFQVVLNAWTGQWQTLCNLDKEARISFMLPGTSLQFFLFGREVKYSLDIATTKQKNK